MCHSQWKWERKKMKKTWQNKRAQTKVTDWPKLNEWSVNKVPPIKLIKACTHLPKKANCVCVKMTQYKNRLCRTKKGENIRHTKEEANLAAICVKADKRKWKSTNQPEKTCYKSIIFNFLLFFLPSNLIKKQSRAVWVYFPNHSVNFFPCPVWFSTLIINFFYYQTLLIVSLQAQLYNCDSQFPLSTKKSEP